MSYRTSLATALLHVLLLAAACGGGPAATPPPPAPPASSADPSAGTAGGEALPVAEVCAALQGAVLEREARELRTRAATRAEETGATPEEILAEWAEDEAEAADGVEPRWTCPAPDPEHHRPQRRFPPRTLADGSQASIVLIDRMTSDGDLGRFVFLAVQSPERSLHLEALGQGSDANGQEWGQFVVTTFDGEGASVSIAAEGLDCVPAGFTDELENEPPICNARSRDELTCTVAEAGVSCERRSEPVEDD